jgi:carbonic anhydrase
MMMSQRKVWKKTATQLMLALGLVLTITQALALWAAEPVAEDPLESLKEGNERFFNNRPIHPHQSHERLLEIRKAQHPFVAMLGCSDSRVPPEMIFDQGMGDVFDVRVAGNVLDPAVLGSLEYAVEHLHVPLIMVMGHERCGAVQAALTHENPHNHINSIIRSLAPAVRGAHGSAEQATKDNVLRVLHQLSTMPLFHEKIRSGQLKVMGGYYRLETGQVEFINVPQEPEPNHGLHGVSRRHLPSVPPHG